MEEFEYQPIVTSCRGVDNSINGEAPNPPLEEPTPVIAVYSKKLGRAVRIDGCLYLDSRGSCHASRRDPDNDVQKPLCLFKPVIEDEKTPAPIKPTLSEKSDVETYNQTSESRAVRASLISQESHLPLISEDNIGNYFIVLGPDMSNLSLDFETMSDETQRKLHLRELIRNVIQNYEAQLITAGKPLKYLERAEFNTRSEYWLIPAIHFIANADKTGEREFSIIKRLENGREDEPFAFKYIFNEKGKVERIQVKFPASNLSFLEFSIDEDRQVETIFLSLGDTNNKNETYLDLLARYGMKNSTLANFIREYSGSSRESKDSIKKATIEISMKKLMVLLKCYRISDREEFITDLGYSAKKDVNAFVKKGSEEGISVEEFLYLLRDIMEVLPFGKLIMDNNRIGKARS